MIFMCKLMVSPSCESHPDDCQGPGGILERPLSLVQLGSKSSVLFVRDNIY